MTTNRSHRGRRWTALGSLCVLALTACGDSTAEVASGPPTGEESGTEAQPDTVTSTTAALQAGGPDRAVITIGRQRYVADLSDSLSICRIDGGAISGVGQLDGFADGRLQIYLPPVGWEDAGDRWDPPSITIDLGTDADGMAIGLHAGGSLIDSTDGFDGVSQVDSFVTDGGRASGSATFIDLGQVDAAARGQLDEPVGRSGMFAIECG